MRYVIASAILFTFFIILSFLVVSNNNELTKWDNSAFEALNNPHGKIVNKVMIDLTKYGREVVWIAVMALLVVFGKKDGRKVAVLLTLTFLVLIPVGTILKDTIDRPRPVPLTEDHLLIKNDTDPSFPSGHATIVSAGSAILLLKFHRGKQIIFSIILTIESILVDYSRIYVGNHYPLDVMGGILLGTAFASAIIASSKYLTPIFSRIDSMKR